MHYLAGAAGGVLLFVGFYAVTQWVRARPVTLQGVAASAAGGLVYGLFATATLGGSFFAMPATLPQYAGMAASGAVGGAVEQTTLDLAQGRRPGAQVAVTAAEYAMAAPALRASRLLVRPAAGLAARTLGRMRRVAMRAPRAGTRPRAGLIGVLEKRLGGGAVTPPAPGR